MDWSGIQRLIESGALSYSEAAERMEVSVGALRQRAYRERWLSPERVRKAAAVLCRVMPEEVLKDAAESWHEKGQRHRLRVFELAHESLVHAELPAPKTWRDAQVADNMARRAVGLDDDSVKGSPIINVQWLRETLASAAAG